MGKINHVLHHCYIIEIYNPSSTKGFFKKLDLNNVLNASAIFLHVDINDRACVRFLLSASRVY